MKQELDAALVRDFPVLYAQRHGDMRATAMCWGFECGDGWEPLIRKLSGKLEAIAVKHSYPIHAMQVKEKFGTLRFYTTSAPDEAFQVIADAERESAITCEFCGQPGKLRDGGWMMTLCDACEIERKK